MKSLTIFFLFFFLCSCSVKPKSSQIKDRDPISMSIVADKANVIDEPPTVYSNSTSYAFVGIIGSTLLVCLLTLFLSSKKARKNNIA